MERDGEWSGRCEIRARETFLALGEACVAMV